MSKLPPPIPGSSLPPSPPTPSSSAPKPSADDILAGELNADATGEIPMVIDTNAAAPAPTVPAERHCLKCGVVLAMDLPCDKHEQTCPDCGEINLRNNGKCLKCGKRLPPMPEIIPAKPAAPAPVSGSITLPPPEDNGKPADEAPAPPPPDPAPTPEEKEKACANNPAAPGAEENDYDEEEEEEILPPVTPPPEGGPEHVGSSRGVSLALLLILVLLVGGLAGYLLSKQRQPTVVEREKVVTMNKEVPAPPQKVTNQNKKEVTKKFVKAPKPKAKKVHRHSRPAPAEKEITFKAEDLVHVWNGPVDQFLDKDDD